MIKIGVYGVCGRMGMRIVALAAGDPEFRLAAAVEREGHPMIGKDVGSVLGMSDAGVAVSSDVAPAGKVDCMLDFTVSEAAVEHVEACGRCGIPIVIGTTGIGPDGEQVIKSVSEHIPIVFSPNMSAGVNLLFRLVEESARALRRRFSIKVDETHHVHKKDSPSGTAKVIVKIIRDAAGVDVPVDARREGEVVGNHGIVFDNEYETLEIRHNAKSRDVFAAGALQAVKFVVQQKKGLYTMQDVLGLGRR